MRFYRQKSMLLGLMALIAPLPLPFNEVVTWPGVIAFVGAAALFLYRTNRGERGVLPYWVMNLLGLLYIPFLFGDLTILRTGRFLTPLVHLALFAIAVKLFALRREKDKWHLFLGLFFLFIASMGTSVHPAAVLYLLVFVVLATLTLMRFAGLHTVSTLLESTAEPRVPVRRFLGGTIVLSLAATIPLFFFLPRLRQPYVYAPAGGAGGVVQVSGFADSLDLGMIDRVRSLRTVVFRFAYETPPPATEMRFKAATYDTYSSGGWRRSPAARYTVRRALDGFYHVQQLRPVSWMKVWLREGTRRLVLPVEASVVDLPSNGLIVDVAGETRLLVPRPGTAEYRVGMAAEPLVAGRPGTRAAELEAGAVTPRMSDLAASVMGTGEKTVERIRRLERYLSTEFGYSLEPVNGGPRPIDSFLFETGEGHCEYFASAMVLLLRSQGIAARLATGYLGAEYNPLEEYHIVRQSNAHAWVEAFLPAAPGQGGESLDGRWMVFDPTPAEARPASGRLGWVTLMSQAYDYLLFRWDRYVLTYGFGDQVDVFVGLRNAWLRFWETIRSRQAEEPAQDEVALEDPSPEEEDQPAERAAGAGPAAWHALPLIVLVIAAALWFWFRRERFSATKAYRALRSKAAAGREGIVPVWIGPMALEKAIVRQHPEVSEETRLIVSYYVRESFAGEELSESELAAVKEALAEAKKKLKRAA